ncbi:PHP domain-containing protein [Methanobacterium oryzae]|uniref:PHP domain-containing protein n=1 Tax=Methanobacterium oryzae TaxID=69540 RepID=UPI003D25BF12
MKYDFHIHSKYSSDGFLDPKKIVKIAIKRGLNGIAVTDHDTIKGGLKTKEYETEDFKVIIGSEVSTTKGEIIGLFLEQEIKSVEYYEVVDEIKAQNGIVVVPHPFDNWRNSASLTKEDYKLVNNIEIFNSRCVEDKYNQKASLFAKNNNLSVIGGSDAHFANEIGNAGIIIETNDPRNAILKNNLKVFGKRSTPLNHVLTKILKMRRKYF